MSNPNPYRPESNWKNKEREQNPENNIIIIFDLIKQIIKFLDPFKKNRESMKGRSPK